MVIHDVDKMYTFMKSRFDHYRQWDQLLNTEFNPFFCQDFASHVPDSFILLTVLSPKLLAIPNLLTQALCVLPA